MKVLAEGIASYAGRRYISAYPVHREHQECEYQTLSELGDIEYVFYTREQGLDYLGLPAGSIDFFYSALAEFMSPYRHVRFKVARSKDLNVRF
jgi:hypothetical protein